MRSKDVDPVKCPVLHAKLLRQEQKADADWKRIAELRKTGQDGSARRMVKKVLGVKKGPPMTEEKKATLADWKEQHKDEIKERKQQEREIRRRTIALLTTGKKRK
jgi:hypothetical protein